MLSYIWFITFSQKLKFLWEEDNIRGDQFFQRNASLPNIFLSHFLRLTAKMSRRQIRGIPFTVFRRRRKKSNVSLIRIIYLWTIHLCYSSVENLRRIERFCLCSVFFFSFSSKQLPLKGQNFWNFISTSESNRNHCINFVF